jgi:hypothetical protein
LSVGTSPSLYRKLVFAWLAFAAAYLALPPIALMVSSRFYVHFPVPLTFLVILGAVVGIARYLEDAVRERSVMRISGSAIGLVAASTLLYVTLTYCPR